MTVTGKSQFSSEQDHADTIIMCNEHIFPYCLSFTIHFTMRHILEVLHIVFVTLFSLSSFEERMEMENYAPVSANPPPRSHDSSLGSSSANPAHTHQAPLQSGQSYQDSISQTHVSVTASKDRVRNDDDQNLSHFPSISQRAALAAVQGYDNGLIFAWLTGFRSFQLGGHDWFRPERLSTKQQEAISALKGCPDSLIIAWLEAARYDGPYQFP